MIHIVITRDMMVGQMYINSLLSGKGAVETINKPHYIVKMIGGEGTFMLLTPEQIKPHGLWQAVDNAHFLGDLTITETMECMKLLCEYYTECAHIYLDGIEVKIDA